MQRRQFLKNCLLSSAALGYWTSGTPFVFKPQSAHAATDKKLVNVLQRGGCDGLNMVVPYGESRYYQLRPNIAIPAAGSGQAGAALDLNGFFGFHPVMDGLHSLYQQNTLAVLPATHYPQASRSHFDSQHYIESGQSERSDSGWLNRHMSTHAREAAIRGISIGNNLVHAMRGNEPVSTVANLNDLGFGVAIEEEQQLLARLQSLYEHPVSDLKNHQLVQSFGQQMLDDIDVLNEVRAMPYTPENGAIYPETRFAQQLQTLAHLLKANIGVEVANVDIGGWDTHAGQGGIEGRQADKLRDLSDSLLAFYTDMGSQMANIAVLVGTEFGRTSEENGSFGTDHGFASAWMVLGGDVNGGLYGDWPGLQESQLNSGRYLEMATDYRDIYGDIVSRFLGNNNLSEVLPGHSYQSLGLF